MKAYGSLEFSLYLLSSSALDGYEKLAYVSAALTPDIEPRYHKNVRKYRCLSV
jgi:hypothetical protein